MSDRDALLAAIRAHPAEDVPRLIFADWLDEHGTGTEREWAAFIRDDVTHAARDDYDPARLRWELIVKPRREGEAWARALFPKRHNGAGPDPYFLRGFPWLLPVSADSFAGAESPVPAEAVEPVFSFTQPGLVRACGWPHFARAAGLLLRDYRLSQYDAEALARVPFAPGLRELDTGQHGIADAAAVVLIRSQFLERLERFRWGAPHTDGRVVARRFAGARARCALTELALHADGIEPLLGECPLTRGVQALDLARSRFQHAALTARAATDLPNLTDLSLANIVLGAEARAAVVAMPLAARLRRWVLASNHFTATEVAALADRDDLARLRALDLSYNAIGNAGASALFRSPHLAGLLVLDLSYCMVGDEAVEALLESPLCDSLVLLSLRGSPASAEAKVLLAARMGDRVRL